jgi:hypothetical protein
VSRGGEEKEKNTCNKSIYLLSGRRKEGRRRAEGGTEGQRDKEADEQRWRAGGRDRERAEGGKERLGRRDRGWRTNLSPSNPNSDRLLDSSFIIPKSVLIRAMSREPEKIFTRLPQR